MKSFVATTPGSNCTTRSTSGSPITGTRFSISPRTFTTPGVPESRNWSRSVAAAATFTAWSCAVDGASDTVIVVVSPARTVTDTVSVR